MKTRAEKLELFGRQVATWLRDDPAEAGVIRERCKLALKMNDSEYLEWVRSGKDAAVAAAVDAEFLKATGGEPLADARGSENSENGKTGAPISAAAEGEMTAEEIFADVGALGELGLVEADGENGKADGSLVCKQPQTSGTQQPVHAGSRIETNGGGQAGSRIETNGGGQAGSRIETNGETVSDSAVSISERRDAARKTGWLDAQLPEMLSKCARLSGSRRAAGVAFVFREIARNLAGRDAATEALVRDMVCGQISEIKKADYERCMREVRARLHAEQQAAARQSGAADAGDVAADGDSADWGGLARKFIASMGAGRALVRWRETWYEWTAETGYYAAKGKEWMPSRATNWMYEQGMPIGLAQVSNFINAVQASVFIPDDLIPPCWLRGVDGVVRRSGSVYVAMKNGILDLESVTFEMGDAITHAPLIPHTPDFFTLNGLPYEFRVDAQCPGLEAALEQWQPHDENDLEGLGQRVLQDFAGYVFEPGQPHQVMMLNYGPGSDGKSQYKELLTALAGVENTSTLGLEALDPSNVNGREDLLGKTLWTIPDANQIEKLAEGTLKAITGGDRVAIARKFKCVVNGVIQAKVLMNCNELPGFKDRSEGVWRRILMLHWRPVTGVVITNFAAKLIADEMPGIFMWALRGWKRVRENGFAKRGVLVENVQRFRRETQHEFAFFDQCVEIVLEQDQEGKVSNEQLIAAYCAWCKQNNVHAFVRPETMGRALAKWVRWSLEKLNWPSDAVAEFTREKFFKRRRNEAGKKRTDYYVRIRLLEDDEAELVTESGGYYERGREQKAPPRMLPWT